MSLLIKQLGEVGYHHHVCAERGLSPDAVALMGTAANMNYAARVVETHAELRVCAVVTAGVEGNAGCAGDGASWHEEDAGWCHLYEGTINTMVFINWPLTPGAMARAVVTMTEGKSAALRDLAISSRYSQDLATGTGTDQYCIAAPLDKTRVPKTNAGQHALVPGPNSGWSEATAAGASQRRLVGPVWQGGMQVTDVWLGDADDPEGGQPEDVRRMCVFVIVTCLLATGLAVLYVFLSRAH